MSLPPLRQDSDTRYAREMMAPCNFEAWALRARLCTLFAMTPTFSSQYKRVYHALDRASRRMERRRVNYFAGRRIY